MTDKTLSHERQRTRFSQTPYCFGFFCQKGLKSLVISPQVKHERTGQSETQDSDGCGLCFIVMHVVFV